ncbi:MAG: LacI family transcriptional regulator [Blastochloris sp.]|nr:LacI family transcriptional regulator [Blastochloris sp.]
MQQRLSLRGYQTLFSLRSREGAGEQAALQQFSSMRVAGLITFAADWSAEAPWVKRLQGDRMPVVHVDPLRVSHGAVVRTDRESAMRQVLSHLRGLGHRRILVLGVDETGVYGRQRIKGLELGCQELGLVWGKDLILMKPNQETLSDMDYGWKAASEVAEMRRRPGAVICLNDVMAFSFMRGLSQAGLKVPRDISVVGYDNEEFSAYTDPALSTVDARVSDLMDRAVDHLLEQNVKKDNPKKENVRKKGLSKRETRLIPQLVLRGSTARARAKNNN